MSDVLRDAVKHADKEVIAAAILECGACLYASAIAHELLRKAWDAAEDAAARERDKRIAHCDKVKGVPGAGGPRWWKQLADIDKRCDRAEAIAAAAWKRLEAFHALLGRTA